MSLLMSSWSRLLLSPCRILIRSSSSPAYRDERVVCNSDGSVIVCWHPEPRFPYEMTRPLTRRTGDDAGKAAKEAEHLKIQYVEDMKSLYHFRHARLQRRDLMRLTWTPKQRWYENMNNRARKYNALKMQRERPYL